VNVRKLALACLASLVACSPSSTSAQPAAPVRADAPKLIVAISVDQFSGDVFDEYRSHYTGGLKRLAGGTTFRNGFQSHAATETCPGHSTLLTGMRPAHNGIVANVWIDEKAPRADKNVYCSEDESVPGSTSTAYTVSPKHLKALTLGDRLKAVSPASRNVAVAGKDRAAVMMGGRNLDQRWYWDGKTFVTDLKGVAVPRTVISANQAVAGMVAAGSPPLDPPALCQAKSRAYQLTPALKVGDNHLERTAGDVRNFRGSPELDGATLALAAGLVQEMKLGRGQATDILSISLSATDYVGHGYGTDGLEMCLQIFALDRELGDFLAMLDRSGINYAVALSADHGGMDIPERLREKGITSAARADAGLAAAEVGKLLAPRFDRTESVLKGLGIGGDIWVDAGVPAAQKDAVIRAAKERYAAHPQVYAAFTRTEIMAVPMPTGSPDKWSVIQRIRASFDPPRSGDLYVVLKPYISPIAVPASGYAATHGSPWDYDRRVPVVFWRKGMAPLASDQPIETVDIMPTLAAMIGLAVQPGSIDGKCLSATGVACLR
jgi:predicted AlkP superfamily pyrophosphatase or phosphodiesterase